MVAKIAVLYYKLNKFDAEDNAFQNRRDKKYNITELVMSNHRNLNLRPKLSSD